jgi:scyllo-inositol 2-dehydrogenase (NADP+)
LSLVKLALIGRTRNGGAVIRTGLVGYGLAGAAFHEPLIRACERLEAAAVLTSRDHPLRVSSIEELIDRSELVVIASPNQSHFPLAKVALEAGRHVVVDKPFTLTVEQSDELITLRQEQKRILTVFHNRRWDGDFLTVRRVLPELGELFLYEANWDRFRPAIKQGWREVPDPGSGVLNDLGPHLIDQALQLFGMPDSISADILRQRAEAKVDDYFELTLHYGARRVSVRSSSLVAEPRPRFAMHGAGGSYLKYGLDPQEAQLKAGMDPRDAGFGVDLRAGIRTLADGTTEEVPTETGRYLSFYEGVAAAILDGAPVPVDPRDARDGLTLIDLARRAAAEGRRLPVPAASSTEG